MDNEEQGYTPHIRIPYELWNLLYQRKKSRQPLAGVMEDIIKENDDLVNIHNPLVAKISKLQDDLDYYTKQDITLELLEELKKHRHPNQTIGGVILELLDIADKVQKGELYLYKNNKGEG